MVLQTGIQVVLPVTLIVMMFRTRPRSTIHWLGDTVAIFLVLLFVFMTARWDLTSYYLRILILPVFAVASWFAYRRTGFETAPANRRSPRRSNAFNVVLIVAFLWLNVTVLRGFGYEGDAVDLAYPLRDGTFYVGGGGTSRWINNHNAFPPQDFAVDIVRLNGLGNRATIGSPSDLASYAIFGMPIYSPCRGSVVTAVDGHADQIPPNKDTANIAGNHVVVLCHDVEILLAHMMDGSLLVAEGAEVAEGQELGAVGNSGNTSQPHLHVHAERGGASGRILDGVGVPMTFEGRFLVRNSLFTGE